MEETKLPEMQKMEEKPMRILAAVNDLFFVGKITAAAKRVGVQVEFIRSEPELLQKTESLAESSAKPLPAMLLVDLNDARLNPVSLVAKLKADPQRKGVRVIGFLSHVQVDLKRAADQAGCDLVLPRSVFSQQLDDLLRQRSCHL
jgi:CheY-like chemotaxis protein